jgi:hypothetical protein
MTFVLIDDPEFANFNFSWLIDETLRSGPRESDLYALVQQARAGVKMPRTSTRTPCVAHCGRLPLRAFSGHWDRGASTTGTGFIPRCFSTCEFCSTTRPSSYTRARSGDLGPPRTDRPWEEGRTLYGSGPAIHPDDLEAAFSIEEPYAWHEIVNLAASAGRAGGLTMRNAIRSFSMGSKPASHVGRSVKFWISI